jgi:hypothetical protein
MFLAIVAIFAIAFLADFGLDHAGFSSEQQQSSPNVRIN